MRRGRFITFEGGEGSGKSTQARHLAERLRGIGHATVVTREPGGTPLGESIRELILGSRPAPVAEFLLFAAARAEHVGKRIAPALASGQWVVCDRFIDSTRVYQGRLARISPELLGIVERATAGPSWPDLTIVLDLPPATGLERAMRRGGANRYDHAELAYHQELRAGFLEIARAEPGRCVVVDGSRGEGEVAADVWSAVAARLVVGA